jgi:outer membrane receptor for monomeric catechols
MSTLRPAAVLMLTVSTAAAANPAVEPTPLPKVTVTAVPESDGYLAVQSRTATLTSTALIDVPQSVSVITRDLIQDQSMQSLADVARYVPGAAMAQGEGNPSSASSLNVIEVFSCRAKPQNVDPAALRGLTCPRR